jgi:hypothetical protein
MGFHDNHHTFLGSVQMLSCRPNNLDMSYITSESKEKHDSYKKRKSVIIVKGNQRIRKDLDCHSLTRKKEASQEISMKVNLDRKERKNKKESNIVLSF